MLTKENLNEIAKILNLEADALQKSIDSEEEVALEIPKLITRTEEQEQELQNNFEQAKKHSYDDGKEKGVKDEINAYKEKFNLTLDGEKKNFENFAISLKEKLQKDIGKPKDKEVEELRKDNETLKKSYEEVQNEYNQFKEQASKQKQSSIINAKLDELIPSENTLIPKEDLKELFKSRYQFEFTEDDKFVVKDKNGNVVKDPKTTSPLAIDDVVNSFSENYIKKATGSGGKDSKQTGASGNQKSYESFVSEMNEAGINEGSADFNSKMNERLKEGTLEV